MKTRAFTSTLIFYLIIFSGCVDIADKSKSSWYIENRTDQEISLIAYYHPSGSSQDVPVSSTKTISANGKDLLFETVITSKDGGFSNIYEIMFHYFTISLDSLVLQFESGSLSYTINDGLPLSPLSPLNYETDNSSWISMRIKENEFEYIFRLTDEHKQAAN